MSHDVYSSSLIMPYLVHLACSLHLSVHHTHPQHRALASLMPRTCFRTILQETPHCSQGMSNYATFCPTRLELLEPP